MEPKQLNKYIIKPVLTHLGYNTEAAQNLLLLTAAQESHMGKYLHQIGRGPARGIFQMEILTLKDIYQNYLKYKGSLQEKVDYYLIDDISIEENLIGNLYYATALARVHYLRVPEPLPEHDDIEGLASYWKEYYNTLFGHGTVGQALRNYYKFVV